VPAGRPFLERARLAVALLGDGRRDMMTMLRNHWPATDELASCLGLGEEVRANLKQTKAAGGKGVSCVEERMAAGVGRR
jgi:hypothetical protein